MKGFAKLFLESILQKTLCWIPLKRNIIIFESYPNLDGSPWMIYNELKKRGFGNKYRMLWAVDASFKSTTKDECFVFRSNFIQTFTWLWYKCHAKLIVDSNRYIGKVNPKTFRMHTQHGAPLKGCLCYTRSLGNVDCLLSLSENMAKLEKRMYPSADGRIQVLGYPTNDRLFEYVDLYENSFFEKLTGNNHRFAKIIGWLPTYRQHRFGGPLDSDYVFPFGVPLFKNHEDFERVNLLLKKENVLLAIQMHHAQAMNFPKQSYSNIVLIDSALKQELGVSTANLMTNFDAMITDYSAAYHEYLLLDRPIALSIDDFDDYAKNPGFVVDYFDWIKGVYLKTTNDLVKFIEDVSKGMDSAKDERNLAKRRIHKYIDNQSTKRVVDFLIENAKL